MGEVRVKDTTLQGIANAIRSKDGTSADILASTFPQRILGIPSGGGGVEVAQGTFVSATNVSTLTLQHGLNISPNFVYVGITSDCVVPNNSTNKVYNAIVTKLPDRNNNKFALGLCGTWGNNQPILSDTNIIECDASTITISINERVFYTGMKYQWFALYINPESEV